jgi:hypothetical protein
MRDLVLARTRQPGSRRSGVWLTAGDQRASQTVLLESRSYSP